MSQWLKLTRFGSPLIIDILLDLDSLSDALRKSEATLFLSSNVNGTLTKLHLDSNFTLEKRFILLESWELVLGEPVNRIVTPSHMYSNGVIFFRGLYTHLRTLPAFRLLKQLNKLSRASSADLPSVPGLRIEYAIRSPDEDPAGDVQPLHSPVQGWHIDSTTEAPFPGQVETPRGTFKLTVKHRTTCSYEVGRPHGASAARPRSGSLRPLDAPADSAAAVSPPRAEQPRGPIWAHAASEADVLGRSPDSLASLEPLSSSPSPAAVAAPATPPQATRPIPVMTPAGRVRSNSALQFHNEIAAAGSHPKSSALSDFIAMMSKNTDELLESVMTQAPPEAPADAPTRLDEDASPFDLSGFRQLQSELSSFHMQLSQQQVVPPQGDAFARESVPPLKRESSLGIDSADGDDAPEPLAKADAAPSLLERRTLTVGRQATEVKQQIGFVVPDIESASATDFGSLSSTALPFETSKEEADTLLDLQPLT